MLSKNEVLKKFEETIRDSQAAIDHNIIRNIQNIMSNLSLKMNYQNAEVHQRVMFSLTV